ncbi:MAG TPA: 3-deoxy-manno-octulosonate cytidylyltransferase [Terriglobia bacterium]|nr:3-deoxy-manno-octulosonate cytidylyltransferase [Terriglobia bacterium]
MVTRGAGQHLSVCGVIPVRMESRRLPGKPLLPICGDAMLGWVYRRARQSPALDRLLVATDSQQIVSYCKDNKLEVVLTSSHHASGTDRLVEVMEQEASAGRAADIYVNIQGDEPMVTAAHIELLLKGLASPNGSIQVSTLKVAISATAAGDPNAVKVVTDPRGRALYFSRAPIPYDRDPSGQAAYHKHLGFYAYTIDALRCFRTLEPSPLERIEHLEQLRFLENGIPIVVLETDQDTIGVDTEEDLGRVEEYFSGKGVSG